MADYQAADEMRQSLNYDDERVDLPVKAIRVQRNDFVMENQVCMMLSFIDLTMSQELEE